MHLALTPEVLYPLVAVVVVAAGVIAVILALARGKDRSGSDDPPAPTAADWTGEAATGAAATVAAPPREPPAQRLTVGEAVQVRDADTTPLPVSSATFVRQAPAVVTPPATVVLTPAAAGPLPSVEPPEPPAPQEPAPDRPRRGSPTAAPGPSLPARDGSAGPAAGAPDVEASAEGTAEPAPPTPVPTRPVAGPAGSSGPVAAAVAQALAARAAVERPAAAEQPAPDGGAPHGDARDRLLAVLLEDPARAVAATDELEASRGQLGEVLARLAASGLRAEQLARLSGFPLAQVQELLAGSSTSQP